MKRLSLAILLFALAATVTSCLAAVDSYKRNPSLPQYDGKLRLAGLAAPVEVFRDEHAVPHIFAENEHDLFFTVGYLQAQDRLWEMILFRAMGQGRSCEIFGRVKLPGFGDTYAIDSHQRLLGMKWLGEVGAALIREYQPAKYEELNSYCRGVNAFIDSHQKWEDLPVELQVLRVRPEPWTVEDIVAYGIFIGSQLAGNMDEELTRWGLVKKLGDDLAWKIFPLHYCPGPTIVPTEILKTRLATPRDWPAGGRPSAGLLGYNLNLSGDAALAFARADRSLKQALQSSAPYASNDWVVAGKLTESGHPMLANDPHLEHYEPAFFYPMHIKAGKVDAFGVAFPGVPYPVLGHTRKLSWGATTPPADVQDIYVEKTDPQHPGKYFYKGEWRPFVERVENIRVRQAGGLKDTRFVVRQTVHGPIINDFEPAYQNEPPLALRWAAWDFSRNLAIFDALIQSATVDEFMGRVKKMPRDEVRLMGFVLMFEYLLKGETIDDFVKAMDTLVVPNQNWVAADSSGHIAYLPGGLVPIRKNGIGAMPAPGDSGDYDWSGFIPLLELPHAFDPERGYMATANNTVVDHAWYPYVFNTSHDEGWRAWRIEELIKQLAPLSMDDMKRIQADVQVKRAAWEVPLLLAAVDRSKTQDPLALRAAAELRHWGEDDFQASIDATEPVVFFQFNNELRRNTLADEAPEGFYAESLDENGFDLPILKAIEDGGAGYALFDDRRTPRVETMDDMIVKSLHDAMAWVDKQYGPDPQARQWGRLHTLTWGHPLGIGPLAKLSVGPYPHAGGRETVAAASFNGREDPRWECWAGPVFRHIIDMGDPDGAQMMIDGSVSGQWLSPHYRDMHELWLNGKYFTGVMEPTAVKAQAKYHLTLEP